MKILQTAKNGVAIQLEKSYNELTETELQKLVFPAGDTAAKYQSYMVHYNKNKELIRISPSEYTDAYKEIIKKDAKENAELYKKLTKLKKDGEKGKVELVKDEKGNLYSRPTGTAATRAKSKYNKAAYDRQEIVFEKGKREYYNNLIKSHGYKSMAEFVIEKLEELE